MRRALLLVAAAIACSSEGPKKAHPVIVVRAKPGATLARGEPTWTPPAVVHAERRSADEIALEIDRDRANGKLRIDWPNACSVEVELDQETRVVELAPFISIRGGNLAQVGFDAPFTLTVEPGCREALQGSIEWRQISGPSLTTATKQNGFVLEGRTLPFDQVHPEAPVWGIVPLSPTTRGEYRFSATFRGGGREVTTEVLVAAAARATGIPSIALGQRIYLGGTGWRVTTRPRDGTSDVVDGGRVASFAPDARGRWILSDGDGKTQSLVAGRHADTPLDCGRSDCHKKETDAVQSSPMTSVFSRGLAGAYPNYDAACALRCHTVGEPGLDDGGFFALLADFGLTTRFTRYEDLPRALRRLSSVGCTACHGPGAIPEPSARWAILRSDVCATCHDSPPSYPHVEAWRKSKMAKSDDEPETRTNPECRKCHTTGGYLAAHGQRAEREEPPEPIGIACTACHAPHAPHRDRLVRDIALPEGVTIPESATKSRICVTCHVAPAATVVFAGTNAPHTAVAGGCVGCHTGHDFVAREEACKSCHATPLPRDGSIVERARKVAAKLEKRLDEAPYKYYPPHARSRFATETDPERARALAGLLLVLEDRAAAVHNPAYARSLLDDAERVFGK